MRLLIAIVVAAAIPVSLSSEQPRPPDPGAIGPYAIGHTEFVVVDTRPDPGDDTVRGVERRIGVNVWYPADATSVIGMTADGVYPFVLPTAPAPPAWTGLTFSPAWERPCANLPRTTSGGDPPEGCESTAVPFPPTYEAVRPSGLGPFPLVVFSAGQNNRGIAYSYLAEQIASHGFVVAVSQHVQDAPVIDLSSGHDLAYYIQMYNRPRDVSAMLDAMLTMNDDVSNLLYNSMRPDRVAAAGHSIGGYAALVLAGGDEEICAFEDALQPLPTPCAPIANQQGQTIANDPDPRIKAIVTLDAVNRSVRFAELGRITIPSLAVGESFDAAGWDTFLGARQHTAIFSDTNHRVDIPGAVHQSFTITCTGIWESYRRTPTQGAKDAVISQLASPWCSTALSQGEVNRLSAKFAIAFLKTHLAGETGYEHILTPGWALTRESNIEFFRTEPTDAVIPAGTFQYFAYQPGSYWFLKNRPGHTTDDEPVANVVTESTETTVTP